MLAERKNGLENGQGLTVVTPLTTLQSSFGSKPGARRDHAHAQLSPRGPAQSSAPPRPAPVRPGPNPSLRAFPPVSNQLGRGGGSGWRGAPWVVSLVTVAKASACLRQRESEVWGASA